MNVVLRLMDAGVELVWWGGGGNFHVQPNCSVAIVLCCVVLSLGL